MHTPVRNAVTLVWGSLIDKLAPTTIDWEVFTLKIIRGINFRGVKFSWFCAIREISLTVDGYNVDEHLVIFWCLPSTTRYNCIGRARYCWLYIHVHVVVVLTFTSGGVDLHAHLSIDHCHVSFFSVFNFCGWPRPRNYFNSEIFPIYSILSNEAKVQCVMYILHKSFPIL